MSVYFFLRISKTVIDNKFLAILQWNKLKLCITTPPKVKLFSEASYRSRTIYGRVTPTNQEQVLGWLPPPFFPFAHVPLEAWQIAFKNLTCTTKAPTGLVSFKAALYSGSLKTGALSFISRTLMDNTVDPEKKEIMIMT